MKSNDERVKSILEKAKWYKMKKKKEGYALITCVCAVVIAIVASVNVSPAINEKSNDIGQNQSIETDAKKIAFDNLEEIELTTFKSKKDLIKKMKSSESYKNYKKNSILENYVYFDATVDMAMNESMGAESSATASDSIKQSASEELRGESKEYSETNTQVQGVDESNIVKTNGDYIYYLYDNILRVFDNKEDKLSLVKEINNSDENKNGVYTNAYELYLSDEYIVVFASSNIGFAVTPLEGIANKIMYDSYYYESLRSSTKVFVYDINTYELLREIETEGNYVSSRKVDDDIYLITNKYVYYRNFDEDEILPLCKDTCVENGAVTEVAIENVKCFPSFEENDECSYLIITSFSLDEIDKKANVETFLGTGSNVYCSRENLYVTKVEYNYENRMIGNLVETSIKDNRETIIRKFAIYDGEIKYVAEGKVDGEIVNQFSMDEYDGNFRITTTTGYTWNDTSENNLYVLNKELEQIGKLEGLAKGEKIYSTRFMGDKCYVVTYKTVDPLFVLDLSNPENPQVLRRVENTRI